MDNTEQTITIFFHGLADVVKAGLERKDSDNEARFSHAGAYYRAGVFTAGNKYFWQEGDAVKKALLKERRGGMLEDAKERAKRLADKRGFITLYRGMSRDEAKEMRRTGRAGVFWTTIKEYARGYAGEDGVVVRLKVPYRFILRIKEYEVYRTCEINFIPEDVAPYCKGFKILRPPFIYTLLRWLKK